MSKKRNSTFWARTYDSVRSSFTPKWRAKLINDIVPDADGCLNGSEAIDRKAVMVEGFILSHVGTSLPYKTRIL